MASKWSVLKTAQDKGAFAAHTEEIWDTLDAMPKRALMELAMRLGGLCHEGNCDEPEAAFKRVMAEHAALKQSGII